MHLDPNQQLYGLPVLEIRRLMRERCFTSFSLGIVADTLKITRCKAKRLVSALAKDGFLVDCSTDTSDTFVRVHLNESDRSSYKLTMQGHALRMATARKPIKRTTADRMLAEFLERVETVNRDPNLLYWIDEVVVFGSFLSTAPRLSDLDLAITYTRRIDNNDVWQSMSLARVRLAQANGRHFRSFLDRLGWPWREIELRLCKGLPAVSMHDLREEESFIRTLPCKQLYVRLQTEA
jgi:hypothetical protein